jgi:hypothetical protein
MYASSVFAEQEADIQYVFTIEEDLNQMPLSVQQT